MTEVGFLQGFLLERKPLIVTEQGGNGIKSLLFLCRTRAVSEEATLVLLLKGKHFALKAKRLVCSLLFGNVSSEVRAVLELLIVNLGDFPGSHLLVPIKQHL